MAPHVLAFTRHGEKPGDGQPPHGVNPRGEHDEHSLSVEGWVRAGGLASVFANAPLTAYPSLVTPQRVIATKPTDKAKSHREIDTAGPTARRLSIDLEDSFEHGHEAHLAKSLLAQDKDALIVWHHGELPELLSHFPIRNASDVPKVWPEDRFDLIWVLSRNPESDDYTFSIVPQMILQQDSSSVE
jgi:hypothetical protein